MAEATLVRSAADQAKQAGETEQRYQARLRSESILQARKRREAEEKRRAPICGGSITSQNLKAELTAACAAVTLSTEPIVKQTVSGHQGWLNEQKIAAFCSRYPDQNILMCDLTDIASENPAADVEVQKALRDCGLSAADVLAFMENK